MVAGAGFIVFRKFADGIKVLGLIGPKMHRDRCNGTYDVPKGTIDPGEDSFSCALREAHEETGYNIRISDVISGPHVNGLLSIWLAEVYDDPVIVENPHNGIVEHEGYVWLAPKDLANECYNYLVPAAIWASQKIDSML